MCNWKRILAVGLAITMTLSLSACGKDNANAGDAGNSNANTEQTEAKQEVNDGAENEAKEVDANQDTNVVDDSASMALYEGLLAGTEKMSISKVDFGQYVWGEREPLLQADAKYTLEEFLEKFFTDRAAYNEGNYAVDGLEYAYIDCGQDGKKELALQYTSKIYGDEYNAILLVKDLDGSLELCTYVEDGYRCYNYITKDGILARGGSGGASNWYDSYYGFDEKGVRYLIYELQTCGCYDLYIGDDTNFGEIAANLGVDDILIRKYSFTGYENEEFDENLYKKYMEECYYQYDRYTESSDGDESEVLYGDKSKYAKFMSLVTDNWHKPDEMEEILNQRLNDLGLTAEMLEDNEPEWTPWEGHDELFEATQYETPLITPENPSWTYYAKDYPYEHPEYDFVTLEKIDQKSNDIIDDEEWFEEIGVESPTNGVIQDPSGQYVYYLTSTYGQYDHEYDTVRVHDNWRDLDVAVLDFRNFIMPDEYAIGDASFVMECVNYVQTVDNVMYVAISHRTYAASAPHNAYVMALDMNDNYSVIWKSEPLVCNARNFAIVDGSLICGYGFTDEPDFIYELNRYTGEKMNTVKVKTGPDYFYVIDGKLYVRTYDTNYVFQLGWG